MSEDIHFTYESILNHISIIEERMSGINNASQLTGNKESELLLDAITMRLQAIGENVKRIIIKNPSLTVNHPEVPWENIIKFRDFISHHYELLDYEAVFEIGKTFLPQLKTAITKISSKN